MGLRNCAAEQRARCVTGRLPGKTNESSRGVDSRGKWLLQNRLQWHRRCARRDVQSTAEVFRRLQTSVQSWSRDRQNRPGPPDPGQGRWVFPVGQGQSRERPIAGRIRLAGVLPPWPLENARVNNQKLGGRWRAG